MLLSSNTDSKKRKVWRCSSTVESLPSMHKARGSSQGFKYHAHTKQCHKTPKNIQLWSDLFHCIIFYRHTKYYENAVCRIFKIGLVRRKITRLQLFTLSPVIFGDSKACCPILRDSTRHKFVSLVLMLTDPEPNFL